MPFSKEIAASAGHPSVTAAESRTCFYRGGSAYVHVPVCAMTRGWASLAHLRSQLVLVPEQLSEQLPVQVMWQVAPPLQLTLPLVPTVSVQVDPFVQFGLQEVPQLPVQVL